MPCQRPKHACNDQNAGKQSFGNINSTNLHPPISPVDATAADPFAMVCPKQPYPPYPRYLSNSSTEDEETSHHSRRGIFPSMATKWTGNYSPLPFAVQTASYTALVSAIVV